MPTTLCCTLFSFRFNSFALNVGRRLPILFREQKSINGNRRSSPHLYVRNQIG
jgi:hypothetical protein